MTFRAQVSHGWVDVCLTLLNRRVCVSSCFLDYSQLNYRHSHAPVLPPNSEASLHSAWRWDSLPLPHGRGPRLVDCDKHTPACSQPFTCTQGSTTATMGGGGELGPKLRDGTADWVTLKGSLNPEKWLLNPQRSIGGKRKTHPRIANL